MALQERCLKKELIQKEDGRYLYLYSWCKKDAVQQECGPGADQEEGKQGLGNR